MGCFRKTKSSFQFMRTLFVLTAFLAGTGVFAQEINNRVEKDSAGMETNVLQQPLEQAVDMDASTPAYHIGLGKEGLNLSNGEGLLNMGYPVLPDFSAWTAMPTCPDFIRGGGRTELMGLGEINKAVFGTGRDYGAWHFDVNVGAEKYHFFHNTRNNVFVSGAVTYRINEHWSATAFGTYSLNPFFHSMAAYPYVTTSRYGGTVNWKSNGNFGLRLGVQREYDPFAHRWVTKPIVAPSFKINKVKIEIDTGPLILDCLRHFVEKGRSNSNSPNIMPHR